MQILQARDHAWQVPGGEASPTAKPAPQPQALLTLEQWRAVREHWPATLPTALLVPNNADVAGIAADLPRFAFVALQFPKWTDGRAYSQARLLRTRHRYGGDLRASGDVVVDMMPLLQRSGFTTAVLRDGQSAETAQRTLDHFAGHYQADATDPQPLFSRQAA